MTHALTTDPPGYAQPVIAGMLAAVVGFASTFALVLAAYSAMGASPAEAASGLLAVCLALAVLNVTMSISLRIPVSFAWSTPGAAFLLAATPPAGGFAEAIGAFVMAGALIVLTGLVRPLGRAIAAIPGPVASAMLAGILLSLCLAPVKAVEAVPMQALPIVAAWLLGLRFARRYAVPLAVLVTVVVLGATIRLPDDAFAQSWPALGWSMPVFTLDAFLRLALPLFVVTMASQNLPGIAVMKANGYTLNPAPSLVTSGLASLLVAPFGGHSVNLAAITAAICASPEAHPDPTRRWVAPVAAGGCYLLLGLLAGVAASFIAASPPVLIQAVAGLALLPSLAAALAGGMASEDERLPAVVTFATTASGVTILGLGAAFWGLVAGLLLTVFLHRRSRQATTRGAAGNG